MAAKQPQKIKAFLGKKCGIKDRPDEQKSQKQPSPTIYVEDLSADDADFF